MQKLCKLGLWSKGAISTLLVCNDVLICAVPKSSCLFHFALMCKFSPVYTALLQKQHIARLVLQTGFMMIKTYHLENICRGEMHMSLVL